MRKYILSAAISLFALSLSAQPAFVKHGTATQLVVNGKPMLMLGGELHNSSSTSEAYMKSIWPGLKALNYNTILAAVTWELIEPREGQFDFSSVDHLIYSARENNLKLVLLWFGSWKNAASTYLPVWVKKDFERFPRAVDQSGRSLEILSTFSDNNMKADAKAFASLMKHIREIDSVEQTVIMVQVENEAGILTTPRDFCKEANAAFTGNIPKELGDYLKKNRSNLTTTLANVWKENGNKTSGTWEEVFGKSKVGGWEHTGERDWHDMYYYTEELFMGYYYARYMGYVAAEGKKEYDIPMYCNAWMKGPDYPWTGMHPGGGPLPSVLDMYRCAGPAIDMISPDIYVPNFVELIEWYDQLGNPMFVPETMGGETGVSRMLWAIGEHGLMGFSPFGVDGSARGAEMKPVTDALALAYKHLSGMQDFILNYQGTSSMRGFFVDVENPVQTFELGDYIVSIELIKPRTYASMGGPAPTNVQQVASNATGGGFIILEPSGEYTVTARSVNVKFSPKDAGKLPYVGIATLFEGEYVDGKWIPGRALNGDEIHASIFTGTGLKMNSLGTQKVTLYRYGDRK